jgi:hypothetical protein
MRRISTSHGALQWVGYAFGWPVAVLRLHSLLKKLDAGVVHTNSLNSWYGWAAARMARRPHVWHARELVWQSGVALKLDRFLTRRYAARVIAMSQAIADSCRATWNGRSPFRSDRKSFPPIVALGAIAFAREL